MRTYYIYVGNGSNSELKGTYYNKKIAKQDAKKFMREYTHVHLSSFNNDTGKWEDIIDV